MRHLAETGQIATENTCNAWFGAWFGLDIPDIPITLVDPKEYCIQVGIELASLEPGWYGDTDDTLTVIDPKGYTVPKIKSNYAK